MRLSLRWAERVEARHSATPDGQALFGIVQGGDDRRPARQLGARRWSAIGFDGYAIGGLAVGEPQAVDARDARRDGAGAARGAGRAT